MRCIMCEYKYSEEHGDESEGFCSDACRSVYEHLYGPGEVLGNTAPQAIKLKA